MGVIRAEPARMTDWAAKSVGLAWRAFDWQLLTYAALLGAIGLAMAYTNSVEDGKLPAGSGDHLHPWAHLGGHRDRGLRPRDRVRLPLAEDARLADLRPPAGPARADPGDRPWRRRFRSMDHVRRVHVPVQRTCQGPDDHRARELPGIPAGPARFPAVHPGGLRPGHTALRPGHAPTGPRDVAGLRRDPHRDALDIRGQPQMADRARCTRDRHGSVGLDVRPAGLPEEAPGIVPEPGPGYPRRGLPAPPGADLGGFRRLDGQRPDQRDTGPEWLSPRTDHRLRVRQARRGARLPGAPWSRSCCSPC